MREITAVLYLNKAVDSQPELPTALLRTHGELKPAPGALLLYLGADERDQTGATATSVVEILPIGGRLVLFDSRTMLHEVTPHTNPDKERLALTLWLGGPHDLRTLIEWSWQAHYVQKSEK